MPFDATTFDRPSSIVRPSSIARLHALGIVPIPAREVDDYMKKVIADFIAGKHFEGDDRYNLLSTCWDRWERRRAVRIGLARWQATLFYPLDDLLSRDVGQRGRDRMALQLPTAVRVLAKRVADHEPSATFRIHYFYSDPVLEAEIEGERHYLAIWDGHDVLRLAVAGATPFVYSPQPSLWQRLAWWR